jgi:predicted enzyme related to lactoylglutathione lyase
MAKRKIIHIDLPTGDMDESKDFYHDLFGWKMKDVPDQNYTFFKAGAIFGGFMPVDEKIKPGQLTVYISSPDIDADLVAVEAKGGRVVVPKFEVPGGKGLIALFADPTGNVLALWQKK